MRDDGGANTRAGWQVATLDGTLPDDLLQRLGDDIEAAGGEAPSDPLLDGAVGSTMFDVPNSEDGSLTVLLPREHLQRAPSQSLVRVWSRDGRRYLGVVTKGPFAEPDSLRGDSQMLVNVVARGGIYLPPPPRPHPGFHPRGGKRGRHPPSPVAAPAPEQSGARAL